MQIFVNKEVKQNTIDYWFGMGIPIVVSWGCTLFGLFILTTMYDGPASEMGFMWYFFASIFGGGHLVLWPVIAWRLKLRANESGNLPYKKGAILSLKLYAIWVVFFILPAVLEEIFTGV